MSLILLRKLKVPFEAKGRVSPLNDEFAIAWPPTKLPADEQLVEMHMYVMTHYLGDYHAGNARHHASVMCVLCLIAAQQVRLRLKRPKSFSAGPGRLPSPP